jgi:hypothetical protein
VPAALRRLGQRLGFAIDLASRDGYQDSLLPSGRPVGTPQQALDCAYALYLNDPHAWQEAGRQQVHDPTNQQSGRLT